MQRQRSNLLGHYDGLVAKFQCCHLKYQGTLTEKQREADQKDNFETRMESYELFQAEVTGWVESMQETEDSRSSPTAKRSVS